MRMESRRLPGCVKSVVYTIPAQYLAASTNIFSETFICKLGHKLEVNKEHLARELGFSLIQSATDGLHSWCNNPGSTVFVLVSVLGNLCRTDCVQMIEQFIQSQTMQLFVKVEETVTDGQPITMAPKFHQIITCCEFSLLQALENVLGSDLVYYQIVGPGDWVMWTTLAKELKGQQLTLLCHSQPVSATRAALCDPMEQETELKQAVETHNIPDNSATRAALCDPMEQETELKQAVEAHNIPGNSATRTALCDPMEQETELKQAVEAHNIPGNSATRAVCCDPMEQETELKQAVETHNNSAVELDEETHLKALECTQIENLKYSHDEPSLQVSSSNNLTLSDSLNKEKTSPRSVPVAGPTITHDPLKVDSRNYQFSFNGQTHVKTLLVDRQNTPGVQVIKHFPDKLLYEESSSKRSNHCVENRCVENHCVENYCVENRCVENYCVENRCVENHCVEDSPAHPQELLDNVPRLSLLEDDFSSLSPNTPRPVAQAARETKQSQLNDLSCVIPSFGKHSVDLQTIPKTSAHENIRSTRQADQLSLLESSSNIPTVLGLATQIPIFSEINVSELGMSCAASSLFALGPNAQFFDVSMPCAGNGYLPQTCVKTLGGHFEKCESTVEASKPRPCGHCGLVNTSPQLQHKLTQSSLTSTQQQLDHHHQHKLIQSSFTSTQLQLDHHHQQVQQQSLLDVAEMKSQQPRLQKLQRQQALTLPQNSPFNSDLDSPTDCNSQNFVPQEIFHQDGEVYQEQQHHRPDPGHTSSDHQTVMYNHQDSDHPSFHLSDLSQHGDDQQQDVQSLTSPYLKPNASRYLICHTPPPGFPDDLDNHHPVSEAEGKYMPPRSSSSTSATEELSESGQFLDKLSQITNMDSVSEQYMAMFQPPAHGVGHPSFKASAVRQQSPLGHSTTHQNMEFSSNFYPAPNTPPNPRNPIKSVISSDSSGGSSECPVFIYSKPFTVFSEGQSSFRTPKPFHPAPLLLDALGRQINASMPNDHIFRTSLGKSGQSHQDGCYPLSRGQLTRCRSLPSNHVKTAPMMHTRSMDAGPRVENLEVELLSLEGWSPDVNGDTIQEMLDKFKSSDGNYIIWKSRRHKKFIISVSHLNQLFHFRVEEMTSQNNGGSLYYLFEGGYSSVSLLDLVQHYRQNGIRISMQSAGKKKTYIENIRLLCPVKVKPQMIRKGTSKSK